MSLNLAPPGTSEFDWPGRGSPSFLVKNFLPANYFLFTQTPVRVDLGPKFKWKLIVQKGSYFFLERQFFDGKISIHDFYPH